MKLIWFFATLICVSIAIAEDTNIIGVVTYTFGEVKINSNEAKENDKIHLSDTLETGDNSRAQVMLVDDNVMHINSSSKISFKDYEFNESENKKWSLFDLIYGSVRSLVNQKYKIEDNQGYQINTPAGVIGVRGTDFLVEHLEKDQRTEVTSFTGEVMQGERGIGRKIRNSIRIGPGHFMQLFAGRRAFERAKKQEAKRFEFLRDTTDHPVQRKHKVFQQTVRERREVMKTLRQKNRVERRGQHVDRIRRRK